MTTLGIYHHTFVFTKAGSGAVVQQAMENEANKAIRFQWPSDHINDRT